MSRIVLQSTISWDHYKNGSVLLPDCRLWKFETSAPGLPGSHLYLNAFDRQILAIAMDLSCHHVKCHVARTLTSRTLNVLEDVQILVWDHPYTQSFPSPSYSGACCTAGHPENPTEGDSFCDRKLVQRCIDAWFGDQNELPGRKLGLEMRYTWWLIRSIGV